MTHPEPMATNPTSRLPRQSASPAVRRMLSSGTTLAWVAFLCVLSQVPFRWVWRGQATFPYDGTTTFPFWNVSRLGALRSGEGFLSFFQVGVPFEVWPSYFFTGLVRQFAALVQPNTGSAHAMVQALHGALLVPAVALLFRSFGLPVRYGAIGGLVYALAGIHFSVTQHVYSYEALVYLVLSLWGIRELALGAATRTRAGSLLALLGCGLALTSLVRVHHEAIIYMPPMFVWTLYHLWVAHSRYGFGSVKKAALYFAGLAIFVAICSVPMLMVTYDLSVTNKTQPHTYETLAPYFSDPRVFGLAFALPEFAGEMSGPSTLFSFGTDSTLSYTFIGTLSVALYATVLGLRARDRRWKDVAVLSILPVILLSYTFGPGNVLHRAITYVFPFLVGIGHSFFGLHLFYLLVGFGVAEGIRQLASGRGWRLFLGVQACFLAAVMYLCIRAIAQAGYGWGFSGSLNGFAAAIQDGTRNAAQISLAAAAVLAISILAGRYAPRAYRHLAPALVVLLGFSSLVAFDLVRPTLGARLTPEGMNDAPAQEIAAYVGRTLANRPSNVAQRAFVVGGWRANALLPLNVDLIQMPGDSGGNKYVTRYAALPPSEELVTTFIQQYGATLFWAERGLDDWHRVLAASPQLVHGFHSEWGGDVYWVKQQPGSAHGNGSAFVWNSPGVVVDQGIVQRTWKFPVTKASGETSLPLMWHPGYRIVTREGDKLEYVADDFGRVKVKLDAPAAIIAEYPNRILTFLVWLSAIAYTAWLVAFLALALRHARASWSRFRPAGVRAPL